MSRILGYRSSLTPVFEGARSKKSRKPGQEAAQFKADAETGKIIIGDGGEGNDVAMEVEEDVVGTAYRDSIRSTDGFSRGPNGRVKYNKDTKKRRREELEGEADDVEMGDVVANTGGRNKKRSPEKVGKEFRSKVRTSNYLRGVAAVTDRSTESGRRRQERWNGSLRIRYPATSRKEKVRKDYE